MKKSILVLVIAGFLVIGLSEIQAQTTQSESPKASSEYNVLDAFSGIWTIQGEARDSPTASYYHVVWTLKGQRVLNGYAYEIIHQWKTNGYTQSGLEITGYDPSKKVCLTHILYDDGSWLNSTSVYTDKRT